MDHARLVEAVAAASTDNTTSTTDLIKYLLPRVLSLTSALLGESSENTTALTKEILDVASKVFTLDADSTSSFLNPVVVDFSSALWPLYLITIPLLIGGVIWYFITTFVLGKNVLGRSFSSSDDQEEGGLEDLTERVMKAAEAPGYS
ncbi:uncharacterized protein LOC123504213 [Portunus trituberculatus]|uniref:uncharacterized protein LOC123504213 n=1 Tax=Portunus trituberculatus TaxID=210409 RepID=UPI001E1CD956|nr:uncharacterized protein LOC123504213 [Portunus trituberculatus]